VSCDLLPTDVPGPHYQGNVFDIIGDGWDLGIFHPPCTYLCNSGVRWLYEKPGRWEQMEAGALFFKRLLCAPIPHIAVENPRIHKHALPIIGRRADCVVQPWMFGDFATKATGFWLRNLPPLVPTYATKAACREALGLPADAKVSDAIHKAPPSADRWKIRSTTFPGIASAAALQWSEAVVNQLS
jgi:hypothetical protein